MKIIVAAPEGKLSHSLVSMLIDTGAEVVALSENPAGVQDLIDRGLLVRKGSPENASFVKRALRLADILFWATPAGAGEKNPRAYQNRLGRIAAEAIRANEIPRVINLSAFGAHLSRGAGHANGLHDVEILLNQASKNITHLRPVLLMEDLIWSLDSIRDEGTLYLPLSGGAQIPMIAGRDVVLSVVARILDSSWVGQSVQELYGPEDLTPDRCAEVLTEALGCRVCHVRVEGDEARRRLAARGIGLEVCNQLLEYFSGMESRRITTGVPVSQQVVTATNFARFVERRVQSKAGVASPRT